MRATAVVVILVSLASFVSIPASGNGVDDVVSADVHFEIPQTDLIPGVAAIRASCDVNGSGEPVVLLANGTVQSTLGASAGPCSIALVLLGVDVALPVFNTTPLGRSSFYLPGISTVTLGIVDLSVDLVTALDSSSRVPDDIAALTPADLAWPGWGVQRLAVHGIDGTGSMAVSELRTDFTYTMSLALTVYAVSIEVYHLDLKSIGSFAGAPSLATDLVVDLRPHALVLESPTDVSSDRASLSWSGTIDADVDHLELWLTDGATNVSYRLPPTSDQVDVLVRPSTHYEARIVSVDGSGQAASSRPVAFDSAPAIPAAPPIEAQGNPAFTGTMIALAILAGIVGYAWGFLRGRKND